ncbi:hypothetical protein FOG18_05270 [Legionella israelensis]|uniref:FAD-dependent monooxygenase n=1 Tax=Legionella israelensis TaxID=454 RepID=UPI00117D7564|nr:FAD-dependent monooxygenase [Legionella israelensis]QDP72022.1 hypothetical protein FOG18_05270 [Legionella israelensis]
MKKKYDVIISGAGPVGLMCAYLLKRQNIDCLIIDKLAKPQTYCKALGIQPRTLELYESLNIANNYIKQGLWFDEQRIYKNGVLQQKIKTELRSLPFGFMSIPQYLTEKHLNSEFNHLGGKVYRAFQLESFSTLSNGIRVDITDLKQNKTLQVEAKYLIACEGAHSVIRKQLGIEFSGDQLKETFMLADVKVNWDLPHNCSYKFFYEFDGERRYLIFIPYRDKNRFRVSTVIPEDSVEMKNPPGLEEFYAATQKGLPEGVTFSDMRWSSIYKISHRIAERYSIKRVFLAGDAAHIHPPVGGQGMNTGMQDAYNLAWKIALVIQNKAPDKLLETYHEERYPVGLNVVNHTKSRIDKNVKETPEEALLYDSQTLINYRNSTLSFNSLSKNKRKIQAGDRTPDVLNLSRKGLNFPIRLFDILRGYKFKLIVYLDFDDKNILEELNKQLITIQDITMDAYVISHNEISIDAYEHIEFIFDKNKHFKNKFDVEHSMQLFIRPDNYIGLITEHIDFNAIKNYLKFSMQHPENEG